MIKLLFLTVFFTATFGEEAVFIKTENSIPGRHIVVLKASNTRSSLRKLLNDYEDEQKVIKEHKVGSFIGYSAKFDDEFKEKILQDPRVAFVEQDQKFYTAQYYSCTSKQTLNEYFLPAISQSAKTIPNVYQYVYQAGARVNAYILDTGMNYAHSEFTGRSFRGPSFIQGESSDDGNGHGTCCAGILGGTVFGAAKRANLIGVKVLSNQGWGSTTAIIAGIDWVANDTRAGKKVISMSLGGGFSPALNQATAAAVTKGIPVFAAAGNENKDASLVSPASEDFAITIAASDSNHQIASFSNYGSKVDLISPGVSIKCASIYGANSFAYLSGTSMATPLAAGVGAVVLSSTTISTPTALLDQMITMSRKDVVTGLTGAKASTPNRLVYNGCK